MQNAAQEGNEITKDRYAHLFSEAGAALAERLDALIDSAKVPPAPSPPVPLN